MNYYQLLFSAISMALLEYLNNEGHFLIGQSLYNIHNVDWVQTERIRGDAPLHTILSGNVESIFVEGKFRIMQQLEEVQRSANFGFWVQDLRFRFDRETEAFEIIEINRFVPLREN